MGDLGFVLDMQNVKGVILVFIIYTICILAMGLYVRVKDNKMSENDKLASFLNGGGNLGPVAIGMLVVTNGLSSGAMIGGPGLGYSTGFIWSITVYAGFMNALFLLAAIGKKMAILKARTGVQTMLGAIGHRYESQTVAIMLGVAIVVFLIPNIGSQLQGGAKLFAVVSGTGNYQLGLFIFAAITILYTISGGMKSLARIAVIQGFIMLISVIALYISTRGQLTTQYGSFEDAMRFIAANKPSMVTAFTWTPLYAFGTALTMSFASTALPNFVVNTFAYNKSKIMAQGIVISTLAFMLIQSIMSGIGPLGYAAIQTLSSGDYVNPYLTMVNLPALLSGIVVAGSSAAIQSTAASMMLIVATAIVKDIYVGFINPKADLIKVNKTMKLLTFLAGIAALLLALFPSPLMQIIINFSNGGMICSLWVPLVMGLYSKRVTKSGAFWSALLGMGTYLGLFIITKTPSLASVYEEVTGNCHPVVIGFLISVLSMLIVSKFTKKVKLGTLQVWFGQEYDERYARKNS